MAKLYAEITSDKGGRKVSKGADNLMTVTFYKGNKRTHAIKYENDFFTVFEIDTKTNKVKKAKGMKILLN